jgi:undecaprenyl-diphosphatase
MIIGYYVGLEGIVVIGVLLGLYFLYKRFWRELIMTAVALGLSGPIFLFLSHIFNRPRPFLLFDKPIWAGPNIPGFPSGHTLSIVVCYGFLIYLLVPKIKSHLGKGLVITFALLVMFYVGFSRLYVGDHYLTDVIAGYAVGIAWFGLAYTTVEVLFQKYYLKKEKRNQLKK